MEEFERAFFRPCTRMRYRMRAYNDIHGNDGDGDDDDEAFLFPEAMDFEEVELLAGAENGAVDLLHPAFTFDNFRQLTRRKIVWLGRDLFVNALDSVDDDDDDDVISIFCGLFGYGSSLFAVYLRPVGLDAEDLDRKLHVYSRPVTEATTTVCDYVFQLMARSNTIWKNLYFNDLRSVSNHTLSWILEKSRNSGGAIHLFNICLSALSQPQLQAYMRVFEVSASPHHYIVLQPCADWSQELIVTVANFLQRSQCAIAFECVRSPAPHPLIIDALHGNCNITDLKLYKTPDIDKLLLALAENKSLVRLIFSATSISDDDWTVLCHSLSRHPKLKVLTLDQDYDADKYSNESKTRRTDVFLKMLQANTVLQKLDAPGMSVVEPHYDGFDERILVDVIQPSFRHLPHVRAYGRQNGGPHYAQVLALALNKVDDSPTLVWMIVRSSLSTILGLQEGNQEAAMVPDA
jgi:hypothetical protein